jgi:hypothetical protein
MHIAQPRHASISSTGLKSTTAATEADVTAAYHAAHDEQQVACSVSVHGMVEY